MPKPVTVDPAAADLVRRAVDASGLSVADFAADVVVRDKKQVYRWLNGERQPPLEAMAKLVRIVADA